MEKTDYDATPLLGSSNPEKDKRENENRSAAKRRVRVRFQVALVTMLCWLLYVWCLSEAGMMPWASRLPDGEGDGEDWSSNSHFSWEFEAKERLEFRPCFEQFQCAKLLLPLDYFNGTHPNSSVSIAIAKLPAKVPVDDARYGGPVLVNPGGPGGSGVFIALGRGIGLQTIIDPATASSLASKDGKFYDIIGFDPRGIGLTEPAAHCMPDEATAFSWQVRQSTEGMLGSSDAALGRLWSMNQAYGASCKQASDAGEGPDIKQYMSTASVARDMLEIAERHAEWVAEKNDETTFNREEVKLRYWGFSYGTYLGATFASMFPDRVGRLVLDGVVNVWDYDNSLGQGSLHDTEKDMKSFYTFCLAAGPHLCSIWSPTFNNIEDIEERVQTIVQTLYHNPITLSIPDHGPDIYTYTDLRALIFSSLYTPSVMFPWVAQILTAVENRNGSALNDIALFSRSPFIYHCPIGNGTTPLLWNDGNVPQAAILCGDGRDQTSLTISQFDDYWHLLDSISPSFGAFWAVLRMQCAAWSIKAVYRFSEDDDTDSRYGAPNGTSHPILWIGNTADPVTPLASARLMQARFPGSGLVIQDSAGHCSLSTPTACTVGRIKSYFQTGKIPNQNTICVPSPSAWSLNSTDPASPFYDPELGPPASEEADEVRVFETDGEVRNAAVALQKWHARHDFLGKSLAGERARGMIESWTSSFV